MASDECVRELAQNYKIPFVTTVTVTNDLRMIRKINTLFTKLEKTGKDIYVQEILNVLRILNNSVYVDRILEVFYVSIDARFHEDLEKLIFAMA